MGYPEELLDPSQQHISDEFVCPICQEVAKHPQACSKCKKAFCTDCIKIWQEKSEICPFKCRRDKMVLEDLPEASIIAYYSLNLRCSKPCGQYINILDYNEHLATCDLPNCLNFTECNRKIKFQHKQSSYCSYPCYLQTKYRQQALPPTPNQLIKLERAKRIFPRSFYFKWDFKNGPKVFSKRNDNTAKVIAPERQFQSLVSKTGISGGIAAVNFVITAAKFDFKVGVTSSKDFAQDKKAFCDLETGFGLFTLGQTRHGSDNLGFYYGEKLDHQFETVIIMELNMGSGEIKYTLNRKDYGVAFENQLLTKGVWYPAIAVRGEVESILIQTNE